MKNKKEIVMGYLDEIDELMWVRLRMMERMNMKFGEVNRVMREWRKIREEVEEIEKEVEVRSRLWEESCDREDREFRGKI